MKKVIFGILVIFGLISCGETVREKAERMNGELKIQNSEQMLPGQEYGEPGYKVVVIDSCEYIYAWFGAGNGGGSLTHKGNCKFCTERMKGNFTYYFKTLQLNLSK